MPLRGKIYKIHLFRTVKQNYFCEREPKSKMVRRRPLPVSGRFEKRFARVENNS